MELFREGVPVDFDAQAYRYDKVKGDWLLKGSRRRVDRRHVAARVGVTSAQLRAWEDAVDDAYFKSEARHGR